MQTGKIKRKIPVVLVGVDYWRSTSSVSSAIARNSEGQLNCQSPFTIEDQTTQVTCLQLAQNRNK
eukprot:803083-Amphidinium_carterae.1